MIQAILIGLCLSAVCGLRVFVPPLFLSIAAQFGWLDVAENFAWLARPEATVALGLATFLEIGAYYIPWLDNLLDTLATPLAIVAGTLVAASQFFDLPVLAGESDAVAWTLAAVAGGGTAAIIQLLTVSIRALSSAVTGGIGNFIVASIEGLAAFLFSVLAIIVPFVATTLLIALAVMLGVFALRQFQRIKNKKLESRRPTTAGGSEIQPS